MSLIIKTTRLNNPIKNVIEMSNKLTINDIQNFEMINSDYDDVNTLSLIYKKPKNNIQNKSEKLLIAYF